jgi:hypothetical protein
MSDGVNVESTTDAIVWPQRLRARDLIAQRPQAFATLYRALREARPLIEPWEWAGLQLVLDRLAMLGHADAHRIGLADEPWAACGVLRELEGLG